MLSRFVRFGLSHAFLITAVLGLAVCAARAEEEKNEEKKVEKTYEVELDGLTLTVPESWKQGKATPPFRFAQFAIPAAEGDKAEGEYVVFYFGKAGGGGVADNVKRWIGQFQPEGRKAKTFAGEGTHGKYTIVDLTGTYNQPIGPPIQGRSKPMPGARMLGAVVSTKDAGDYFIKFTGPEKTVTAAADAFRASFGGDPKTEKEAKEKEDKPAAE